MTYDLHGVWDKNDTNIGPFVLAHTNLTEIMDTMQLFRNVEINPSQMVMGIGFYGRSFTLVDGVSLLQLNFVRIRCLSANAKVHY